MTTPTAAAGGLFDRLMAVNREVGRVAAEQGDLIEISAPGYEHSTASARARGLVKPGIYTTRARQAQTHACLTERARDHEAEDPPK